MDTWEYYAAFAASLAFWPVATLLSGMLWYSFFASLLVYVLYIFMSMVMESDYDV